MRREQDRLWFDALERRLALAATPTAIVSGGTGSLIGQEIPLTVTFDNTSANPADIGYSPYVDIVMPATGNAPPSPYNGISFKPGSATYNGIALPTTVVTFDAAGKATHPFAKDNAGKPLVVSGKAGDQLVVTQLPFGSYGPAQPPAAINFTGVVSPLADPNSPQPYTITATGGFQYQLDTNGNPTIDEATVGAPDSEAVRPQLFRIRKTSTAPEGETATGPNFQHTYTVSVDVAPGQTITNLQLSDLLPDNVQFVSLTSVSGSQTTAITIDSTPSRTVPGGILARTLNRVVGTASESDAQMTFTYFVPRNDKNGAEVIDLDTGGITLAVNQATARGTWASANPNFPDPQVVVADPAQHTLTAKTTALQKSARDITSSATVTRAGDTIEYTLNFQVSDFFALENFEISDVLTDGQDFDTSFTPTITYRQKSQTFTTRPFAPANFTVAVQSDYTTTVDFDVSSQLAALGLVTGRKLLGAGVPNAGTGNPATLPTANPAGPGTTGTITFRTRIRNKYRDNQDVVQGDVVSNTAASSATVLDYATLAPTANTVGDGSSAAVVLSSGAMTKSVYAVNGVTVTGTPVVKAGDSVTFRLTYSLPFSSIKDYTLTDFLPLPIFQAQALTLASPAGPSGVAPAVGQWRFGPSDTYRSISGITPANPAVDSAANSLTWNFGTFEDNQNRSATTDILFTVTASNRPFADGLLLTNQGQQREVNTAGVPLTSTGLAQVRMAEPQLKVTKGAVSTNNPAGIFSPTAVAPAGVTFSAPGTPGASFTGTITSGGLASRPIDATLSNVLGNDLVRFCIIVENTGSGPNGAFDVSFRDTFDTSKMQIPGGGLNLRITDGTGAVMGVTDLGGGIFGNGLMLNDPGPSSAAPGSLDPGKTTAGAVINNGRNIAVITYDLQLLPGVLPSDVIRNTATVTNYAATETGPNFVPEGISDSTTVTVMAPKVTKRLVGTSIPSNGTNNAVIGEIATFELQVQFPPGTTTEALVVDTLPTGLAFVQMVGSPIVDPGVTVSNATWATPTVTNDGRTVTFDLGTVTNSATDRSLRGVTLRYEAVVLNVSSNVNFKTLTNSAKLTWTGHTELPAATSGPVTVIESKLKVTKTPSRTVAQAGDVVTYTIVVSHNADSRADAHNVDLSDVIPAGLTYVPGSLSNTAGVAPTTLTPP
ncbi:MAG: isopeptide-forming domain-containing fimbrial protein, partial [Planctomycetia bacterium]